MISVNGQGRRRQACRVSAGTVDLAAWAKVRRFQTDRNRRSRREKHQPSNLDLTPGTSFSVPGASFCTLDDGLDIWPTFSPEEFSSPCDTPTNSSRSSPRVHPHQAVKMLSSEDVPVLQFDHSSSRSVIVTNTSSQSPSSAIVGSETHHLDIVLQSARSCCNIQLQMRRNYGRAVNSRRFLLRPGCSGLT
jgi:hypothetical protein